MSKALELRQEAAHIRSLAAGLHDEAMHRHLLKMAKELEAAADEMERNEHASRRTGTRP